MTLKSRGKASQKTPRDSKARRSKKKSVAAFDYQRAAPRQDSKAQEADSPARADWEAYFKGHEIEDTLEAVKIFQEEAKEIGQRYEANAVYLRKVFEEKTLFEKGAGLGRHEPWYWKEARKETQAAYEEEVRFFLCNAEIQIL